MKYLSGFSNHDIAFLHSVYCIFEATVTRLREEVGGGYALQQGWIYK
jgi:hypothetical protein